MQAKLRVLGHERNNKTKRQNPFPLWLEAQPKSKGASLPTPLDCGGAENSVKGRDERPTAGALDSLFRADAPVCLDNGHCRHTRNDTWFEFGCTRVSVSH